MTNDMSHTKSNTESQNLTIAVNLPGMPGRLTSRGKIASGPGGGATGTGGMRGGAGSGLAGVFYPNGLPRDMLIKR